MKERFFKGFNIFALTFTVLILATVQSSLWFQIFGYFPSPAFWIPAVIYVALFRSTLEAVIMSFLFSLVISTMSSMPEGVLVTTTMLLALSARMFRQRIFWNSNSYIMMITGVAALFFHLYFWILSSFFADFSMHSPQVLDWLLEALLTPLVAPILFKLFQWIDRITRQEPPLIASADVV